MQTVSVAGLPANLDPKRLRVAFNDGQGNAIELGQIKVRAVALSDAYAAEVRKLNEQIEAISGQINALSDADETARLKLKFLEGIAQGFAKESWQRSASGNANVGSWREALALLGEGGDDARDQLRKNARLKQNLEQQLSVLSRELSLLQGRNKGASQVLITVAAEQAQTGQLTLSYFQAQAFWRPEYEARLDSERAVLTLAQKAVVTQRTSEDWDNVAMQLSTSEPSSALAPPQLPSRYLEIFKPEQYAGGGYANDRVIEEAVVTGSYRKGRAAPQSLQAISSEAPQTRTEVGNYNVTYTLPGRVDIANRADDEQRFALADFDSPATLTTRIVPHRSTNAFLTAKFKYTQNTPLFAARLLIYVDGVYVGENFMQEALPQAEVTLPMGQDRLVDLDVRNQGERRADTGFIGRRQRETTEVFFDITNRRLATTQLEVIDRLPIAVDKEIKVELGDDATPATTSDFEDKPGVLLWTRGLQGGEKWRINHSYTVTYPADERLRDTEG